jgi:hypothetical protein
MGNTAIRSWVLAFSILALSGTALSAAVPNSGIPNTGSPLRFPGAPKPVYDDPKSPYPMTYADEVAHNLGVRDGHMDVFSSAPVENNPLVPVVSGGLGGDGAMLKLQWHPGL